MRQRGRRLPWRDVINGPVYIGDLRSHTVERAGQRYRVLTLFQTGVPIAGAAIPDLHEPVLLGFSPLAFEVRGFELVESAGERIGVVQEWHCELP